MTSPLWLSKLNAGNSSLPYRNSSSKAASMDNIYPKIDIRISVNGIAQMKRLNVMAEALKNISFLDINLTTNLQKDLNFFR